MRTDAVDEREAVLPLPDREGALERIVRVVDPGTRSTDPFRLVVGNDAELGPTATTESKRTFARLAVTMTDNRVLSQRRMNDSSSITSFEPLLRATCTHETDPSQPIDAVVAELVSTASRLGEARPRPTR